jgi:hypothetical protein
VEVSGQLHAPAALPLEKDSPVPIVYRRFIHLQRNKKVGTLLYWVMDRASILGRDRKFSEEYNFLGYNDV